MKFILVFLLICQTAKTPPPDFPVEKISELRMEIGYLMLDKDFKMKPDEVIDAKIKELQDEIEKLKKQ